MITSYIEDGSKHDDNKTQISKYYQLSLEELALDLARQTGPADPDALPRNTATVLRSESCSDDARRSTSHAGRVAHVMRLWSTFARRGLRKPTESVGESNIP